MLSSNSPFESGDDGASSPAQGNNLLLRIVSAIVLAPVALIVAWLGGWLFALFWGIAAIVVLWEWVLLLAGPDHRLRGGTAAAAAIFVLSERRLWITGGILYAGVLLFAPLMLRYGGDFGFSAIIFVFAVVWTTDILGYCGGRAFGGPKLAPAVSPKKTWSGAVSGAVGATAVGAGTAVWLGFGKFAVLAAVAFLLSIATQGGDLMESAIKRRFGAKDASHLIPGHGGVMDRLDGFWAAALVACLIGLARGGFDDTARGLLLW